MSFDAGDQVQDVESDRVGVVYRVVSNEGVSVIFPEQDSEHPEFTRVYSWAELRALPPSLVKV